MHIHENSSEIFEKACIENKTLAAETLNPVNLCDLTLPFITAHKKCIVAITTSCVRQFEILYTSLINQM